MTIQNRICDMCGQSVTDGSGLLIPSLKLFLHDGECGEFVSSIEKDYSKSEKGRFRTRREVLDLMLKHTDVQPSDEDGE